MTPPLWPTRLHRFEKVLSTMDTARELADQGCPEGTTVVATVQTRGRGRRGRAWFSAPDAGLWFTLVLRPTAPPQRLSELGLVAGASVLQAIHSLGTPTPKLKWPNDIMVNRRKLAGILLEAEGISGGSPTLRVGVGLNLKATPQSLPEDLEDRYIGLEELVSAPLASALPETCLQKIVPLIQENYARWQEHGLGPTLDFWKKNDWLMDHSVKASHDSGIVEGKCKGLDPRGALLVESKSRLFSIHSGEVFKIEADP